MNEEKLCEISYKVSLIENKAYEDMELIIESLCEDLSDEYKEELENINGIERVQFRVHYPKQSFSPIVGLNAYITEENPNDISHKLGVESMIYNKYPILDNDFIKINIIRLNRGKLKRPHMRLSMTGHNIRGHTRKLEESDE